MFEKYGPPATVAAATQQALELEREYQTDPEYLSRVEIIHRLADASSAQSRETLTRLFLTEKDLDLRVQMVSALPFVDAADLNPSLPILREALKPGQPRELREAGLDAIQSLNDPRTIPLLQLLLNDPDEELRESATRTSEYYHEVLELDRR
jgi:HEAT repeat protein